MEKLCMNVLQLQYVLLEHLNKLVILVYYVVIQICYFYILSTLFH